MFPLLYKYLIINKRLELPGIGCFYIRRVPATTDIVHKLITAPQQQIHFDASCTASAESISRFVDRETGSNQTADAARFLSKLSGEFGEKDILEIPMIGTLTRTEAGIEFRTSNDHQAYFPPVHAERIIREDAEHHILVGDAVRTNTQMIEHFDTSARKTSRDYWWVYALILAVIAIALIVYYHWQQQSVQQVY